MRVLLVDDLPDNLRLLEMILHSRGCETESAGNGHEALEKARLRRPDVVVSDILMPGMDGFALCRAWTRDPILGSIPFVFYSATYLSEEDEAFGLSLGAVAFLRKPMDQDRFVAEVERSLQTVRSGTLPPLPPGAPEEPVFLKLYNERLISKLEKRTNDLHASESRYQQLNAELEQRVRTRTAELEAANRELEAFSYSVSHDLRAPLRAIDGFSALLVETCGSRLDDEGRRILDRVRAGARRMGQLIDALLVLSRVGRSSMVRSRVEMGDMARAVFEEVAGEPAARERIAFRLAELPSVGGDPALLRQVWTNLLSNAVKFSAPRERPAIGVEAGIEGDAVIYRVRDNGVGFDAAYAGKLFGAFQRLHGEDRFEGTGIGLAIVRRIVTRHGGSVWAEGSAGEGATFSFSLPREGSPGACR